MKNKMGRPKIEIDFDQLEKLCSIQCTLLEISSFLGCSGDTIERRISEKFGITFAEHYEKYSSGGKISLRRSQYKAALSGNTAMLIWLGKQCLDQKDKAEHNIEITDRKFELVFHDYHRDDPGPEK